MARAQRRRGSRGRRSRERRQVGGEDVTESGAPVVAAVATARVQPQRSRSWSPLGLLKRLQPRPVADVISELRKVTWPTFAETRYLTIVVAIVAIVIGLILGAFDLLFGWIVEQIFFN